MEKQCNVCGEMPLEKLIKLMQRRIEKTQNTQAAALMTVALEHRIEQLKCEQQAEAAWSEYLRYIGAIK